MRGVDIETAVIKSLTKRQEELSVVCVSLYSAVAIPGSSVLNPQMGFLNIKFQDRKPQLPGGQNDLYFNSPTDPVHRFGATS